VENDGKEEKKERKKMSLLILIKPSILSISVLYMEKISEKASVQRNGAVQNSRFGHLFAKRRKKERQLFSCVWLYMWKNMSHLSQEEEEEEGKKEETQKRRRTL